MTKNNIYKQEQISCKMSKRVRGLYSTISNFHNLNFAEQD